MEALLNESQRKIDEIKFWRIEADIMSHEPANIFEWTNGLIGQKKNANECWFYQNPCFGPYANLDFIRKSPQTQKRVIFVPFEEEVFGFSFNEQFKMLPLGFRVASAVEVVAATFTYQRQTGEYPDFGHLLLATSDIIPYSVWPSWWRDLYGINSDRRVFLQVGNHCGVFIRDYPSEGNVISNRQIVIAAALEK